MGKEPTDVVPTEARPPGRPSKYDPAFNDQAFKLCLLGATDADMARFFDVDEATINRWKIDHPGFCESLKGGKAEADSRVAQSLYRRALGYEVDAVKIFGDPKTGDHLEVPYTEKYPPDTTAAIFWLKNRRPDLWRDRHEITGPDGQPLFKVYRDVETDDV